jgi:hypothetical protein
MITAKLVAVAILVTWCVRSVWVVRDLRRQNAALRECAWHDAAEFFRKHSTPIARKSCNLHEKEAVAGGNGEAF